MKVTVNLSPLEIHKLGKLTNASFKEGWITVLHTSDDVCFAIHQLINMITELQITDCDGECNNCEYQDVCSDNLYEDDNDEEENNN